MFMLAITMCTTIITQILESQGQLESFVPPGLGILVLGTDETTVEKNTVTGNNFSGITVFSTLVLGITRRYSS